MSRAHVGDIELLKMFRAQLFKFGEAAGVALGDAESEIHRTISWLENEQQQHWVSEHRKRLGKLAQAKEALRMKKVFAGPAGSRQSAVDEEKLVQKCTKLVEEAERKINACKQWSRRLQKEMTIYKGQTQRFATSTTVDIPLAAATLGKMIVRLESYASLNPEGAKSAVGGAESAAAGSGDGGMTRPGSGDAADIAAAFAALRKSTPAAVARAAAEPEAIRLDAIKAQPLDDADVKTLGELPGASPIDLNATLVISSGIIDKQRLYLERVAPCKDGDTGWFIGPAEVNPNPFIVRVSVKDVLGLRPDWAALLALPTGTLAIVDTGVIGAVLNSSNRDVWGEATMKALDAASSAEAAASPAPQMPQSSPEAAAENTSESKESSQ
jgi:hypothetical protein